MVKFSVDASSVADLAESMEGKINKALQNAARDLSLMTHAHILEEAQSKLHSSREKYVQAMGINQVNENVWVITLNKSAVWIEDGMDRHSMVDDLLKSPKAKTAKNGSKYLVVPFQHNKGASQQTQAAKSLTDTLKSEMKKRDIPYGKIEKHADGSPKLGLLHKFDIESKPTKTHHGVGQGHGPIGAVKQGATGIPYLQGVRVYQKKLKDASTGREKVVKNIMTFRVVSSKHAGTGRWVHPGVEAKNFFEEAARWATELFDKEIGPKVLEQVAKDL